MGSYLEKHANTRCVENNENPFEMAGMEDQERELYRESNTSYNGTFVWYMENYKAHRQEAIDRNLLSQTSLPCFTCRDGYKYCLRMYLHGDDGYLTIALVQMSTRNDINLLWPVNHRACITLICQGDKINNKVHTFEINAIHRPYQEMTTVKCWPFVHPIDSLEKDGFVVEDRMIIKLELE
jgi:MATH domain.